MSNTNRKIDEPVDFGDFLIVNHEKLDRAINGTPSDHGKNVGGVGKDATPEAILAEYDRLGGLVKTKEGMPIATGAFYDFDHQRPRTEAVIEQKVKPNKKGISQVRTEETDGVDDKPRRGKRKSPADQ